MGELPLVSANQSVKLVALLLVMLPLAIGVYWLGAAQGITFLILLIALGLFALTGWNLKRQKQATRRLSAQYAVTCVLAEAPSLQVATPRILQAVCESLGWNFGELWCVDEQADLLRWVAVWHQAEFDMAEFAAQSRNLTFAPGVGIPGQVWQKGEAIWIADFQKHDQFVRKTIAPATVHSVCGFPIRCQDRLLGVMTFFSQQIQSPDASLLTMMETIGIQIGQLIDRQHTEEALRLSEEVQRLALAAAQMGAWDWNIQTGEEYWSAEEERIFGLTPGSFTGGYEQFLMFVHPRDREKVIAAQHRSLTDGEDYAPEYRIIRSNGNVRWVTSRGKVFRDAEGNPLRMTGVTMDITERKRSEIALAASERLLRQAEEKYRSIFENAVTGIFQSSIDGQFLSANPALAHIYGYDSSEDLIYNLHDIKQQLYVDPNRRDEFVQRITEVGSVSDFESQVYRQDGQVIWVSENAVAIRDERGSILYFEGTVEDVTERKRAQEALQHQLAAIEATADGIAILNAQEQFVYMNTAYAKVYGYDSPSELMGITWRRLYDTRELQRFQQEVMPQFFQQGFWRGEAWGKRKDGSCYLQEISLTSLENGGLVCIVQDITARKQAEVVLREREERFRSLLTNISGAVYRCSNDDQWTMEFISEAIEEITGYQAEDFIQNKTLSFIDIIPPADTAMVNQEVLQALQERRPYVLEYQIRHADSNIRWVYEKGQAIRDEQGQVVCLDGVIFDITDRKRTEERLRLLESVVVNTNDSVVIAEATATEPRQLRIVYVNQAFMTMTGYSLEEAIDRSPVFLLGENSDLEVVGQLAQALASQAAVQTELIAYRKDGSEFWLELEMVPIANEEGAITHWISVQRDTSDRKQVEATLRKNKEVAEEANRAKSQFLANMSHELRTPLNAIIGYSEMLQEDSADLGYTDLVPDLERIRGAGKHLLALINDILDISKIEAGKMELYLETFDIRQLIAEVESTIQPVVETNHNRLEIYCAPNLGMMHADLTKVRQALFNLLSNAAKFTEHGTITLTVSREAVEEAEMQRQGNQEIGFSHSLSRSTILFQVTDSGIGMTLDQMQRVFQAFTQADASTTRKYGGTGLGLAITRHFCQMMGGDISVSSNIGEGSTFTIALPAEVWDSKERSTLEPVKTALNPIGTVLVIDDDSDVRQLMMHHLERDGFRVITAATGDEGLRLARELRPDTITLDVLLPNMNGWEVLAALKADPELADIPVVVMSIVDDKRLGFTLGASDYLTKPVDFKRLARLLERYQPRSPEFLDSISELHPVRRVLIAEDDRTTREMFRRMLDKEGWAVIEAENGRIALEQLSQQIPHLILLDLMMPEMDGFQFINAMRQRPEWRSVPIIVVTAMDLTPSDRLRLTGSVEQVLQKGSYHRDDLLREVRDLALSWIQHRQAR
ncbi:MAG TPA: PAS domain S-box protein [Trichocoleus sp.]|jgi:PAS domain S-box-containing protein